MKQKIVFLDVDGTLVDFKMTMPESARKALELAREMVTCWYFVLAGLIAIFIHG